MAHDKEKYRRTCTVTEFLTQTAGGMEVAGELHESLSDRVDELIDPIRKDREWLRFAGSFIVRGGPLPDDFDVEMRRGNPPFDVVGDDRGPGHVRSNLKRADPVLFHLRDPWGSNRVTPDADRWSGELPKLLKSAGPGRKFLITSRSDVLQSAGPDLLRALQSYIVTIEIEDYGPERLGLGGVGLSAVLGVRVAGARQIVAVDLSDEKLAFARALGATHLVNAGTPDAVQTIRGLTGGGVEIAFDMAGAVPARLKADGGDFLASVDRGPAQRACRPGAGLQATLAIHDAPPRVAAI